MPDPARQEKPRLHRIGELAELAGVSRQVVSTYCMYGLIQEADRTPGGHRLFGASMARRIQLIQDLKRRYTLQEIREIFIRDRF